jgi:hypothetical protein
VPFAVVALGLTLRVLPESRDPEGRHLDPAGQTFAIATLALLTLAAIEGPHWGAAATLISIAVAVIAGVTFLSVETQAEAALLPLAILKRQGLAVAMAVASMMTA